MELVQSKHKIQRDYGITKANLPSLKKEIHENIH